MINRWEQRTEPNPGNGTLYWHILLGDQPQVLAVASVGQERLAAFTGLHFTPLRWLHITTLVIGPTEDFTPSCIEMMTNRARHMLSGCQPITVTLSAILYHPEAIVLKTEPDGALKPIRDTLLEAARITTHESQPARQLPWVPHVTLAYSTKEQPAGPIIAALGRKLPACTARIDSISLVAQDGPERLWNWRPIANVPLGTSTQDSE
jgi:2'-5' RNA ligase